MGRGILDKVSREDRENARMDRDSIVNPPEYDAGMEEEDDFGFEDSSSSSDEDWGSGDSWGSSDSGFGESSFNSSGFGSSSFGDSFGSNQSQEEQKNEEDEIFEAVGKFFSGFKNFISEFIKSLKTFNTQKRLAFSKTMMLVSVILIVVSIVAMILGLKWMFGVMIGSMLNIAWGVVMFMFAYDKDINGTESVSNIAEESSDEYSSDDLYSDDEEDEEDLWGEDYDDEEDTSSDELDFDYEDIVGDNEEDEEEPEEELVSKEEILERVSINNGMVTRQYLYDVNIGVLQSGNKSFSIPRVIREGSEEFDAWESVIQKSAELFRGSQEDMPYLIEAKEKLFYIMLEVKRVKWIKNLQQFVDEIVQIYRYDKETGHIDKTIYGLGDAVGDKWIIRIMKGETALITLKDAYGVVKDEVLNSKNYMPVILGVDAEGTLVWKDFKSINTLLVAGMPRSGKSWLVKAMLYQMMMYLSPRELNFVFMDPKDKISDFRHMHMPHIKKFVTKDEDILNELRHIVRVEGARRKKLFGDVGELGVLDIWDFRKKQPDVEMPLLYVVIDEVVTLADRMDKETKAEFQGLLRELVSQLPALGIRLFMIPHLVKDQVLSKSTTDLIPCRISVAGDAEHIEKTCGVKNFPHKLTHVGDTAIRLGNEETKFMHGIVLAKSNEEYDELFDYLAKLWVKIDPGCERGSVYEEHMNSMKIRGILNEDTEDTISNESQSRIEILDEREIDGDIMEYGNAQSDEDDEFDLWG